MCTRPSRTDGSTLPCNHKTDVTTNTNCDTRKRYRCDGFAPKKLRNAANPKGFVLRFWFSLKAARARERAQLRTLADSSHIGARLPWAWPASHLKSVTGESSAWTGRPLNQRLFRSCTAFSASSSYLNCKHNALNQRRQCRLKLTALHCTQETLSLSPGTPHSCICISAGCRRNIQNFRWLAQSIY